MESAPDFCSLCLPGWRRGHLWHLATGPLGKPGPKVNDASTANGTNCKSGRVISATGVEGTDPALQASREAQDTAMYPGEGWISGGVSCQVT